MKIIKFLILFSMINLIISCSSNSAETPENTEDPALVEEIQQLDSLSNDLDSTVAKIEESTATLESLVEDLDDFNE